jgi:hypothetical protein
MQNPDNMSVKQWINRILNINSYLPFMQRNAKAFTEEELQKRSLFLKKHF